MALRTLRQRIRAFNAAEPDARDLEAYVPEALADGEVANLAIADRGSWTLTSVATDVESLHGAVVRTIRPTGLTSRAVSPETAPGLGDITAALFCAWIKPVQLPAGSGTRIVHLGREANENFSASIGSTAAGVWRGQTRATANSNVNSATTMQVGRWDHVAFYFSNGGRMELSVNGLFPSISASAQSMTNAVATSFIIGAPADGAPDSLRAHVADAQWFVFDQTLDFDGWRPIAETSYCQGLRFYNPLPSRTYFLPSGVTTPVDGPPLTLQWEIQGLEEVKNQVDLRWSVREVLDAPDLDLFWSIREEVERAQTLVWNLREEAAQQQTLQWAIAEEVARTLELRWEIQQEGVVIVQRPIEFQWALRENVSDTLDAQWKIRSAVDANVADLRWQIRESIDSKLLDLFWSIRQNTERPYELQWQIAGDVTRTLTLQWRIGGVPIPRDPDYILKIMHDDRLLEILADDRRLNIKAGD